MADQALTDAVSRLITIIEADNSPFKKAINEADKAASKFSKTTETNMKQAAAALGTLVTGFGLLGAVIFKGIGQVGALADNAAKLGIGADKLQGLQVAAKEFGASADDVSRSVLKMQQALGAVSSGNGKAAQKVLEQLGLDADKLARSKPEVAYLAIADAISKLDNQAVKANAVKTLFGRSANTAFITSDIKGSIDDFKQLGAVLDSDVIAKLDTLDDTKGKIGTLFDGFGQQLAAQFSEPMQQFYDYIIKSVKEAGGLEPIAAKVAASLMVAVDAMSLLGSVGKGVIGVMQGIGEAAGAIKIATEQSSFYNKVVDYTSRGIETVVDSGKAVYNGVANTGKAIYNAVGKFNDSVADKFRDWGISLDPNGNNKARTSSIPNLMQGSTRSDKTQFIAGGQTIDVNSQLTNLGNTTGTVTEQLNKFGAAAEKQANVFRDAGPRGFSDLVSKIQDYADPVAQDDNNDFVESAAQLLDRFKNYGNTGGVQQDLAVLQNSAELNGRFGDNSGMLEVVRQLKEYIQPGSSKTAKAEVTIAAEPEFVIKHLKTAEGQEVVSFTVKDIVAKEARKVSK